MKKLLTLVLALCMAASVCTGCGSPASSTPNEAPSNASTADINEPESGSGPEAVEGVSGVSEETLRIAAEAEPSSLVPVYAESNPNGRYTQNIYNTLFGIDLETNEILPELALDYEWVDDTHLKLTLREGVKFHDGSDFTAADVLYTFKTGTENSIRAQYAFYDAENSYAENDYTVVLALNYAKPNLPSILSAGQYFIISESYTEAAGGVENTIRKPNGTGPYKFVEWVDGDHITFERFEDYWDQDNLPYYQYQYHQFVTDSASRALALESGDVDVAVQPPSTSIDELNSYDNITAYAYVQPTVRTIWLNYDSEPLQDQRVREAIRCCIDPQAYIEICQNGYGEPVLTCFSPANDGYLDLSGEYPFEVDYEKGKQLLADAGYDGGLTLVAVASSMTQSIHEVLQAQLENVGITLKIDVLEMAVYNERLAAGDYDINIGTVDAWDTSAYALTKLDGRSDPAVAQGSSRYQDEALYELLDTAKLGATEEERRQAVEEIQRFILDHCVCIGICQEVRFEAIRSDLTGIQYDCRGWPEWFAVRPIAG